MGTVARTGIVGFLMGSTAEFVLRELRGSVVAVKPPGFVTPVTLPEGEALDAPAQIASVPTVYVRGRSPRRQPGAFGRPAGRFI